MGQAGEWGTGDESLQSFWPSLEISPGDSHFAGPGETNDGAVIVRPFKEWELA